MQVLLSYYLAQDYMLRASLSALILRSLLGAPHWNNIGPVNRNIEATLYQIRPE